MTAGARILTDTGYSLTRLLALAGIGLAAIFFACARARDRRHMCREQELKNAVRQRTEELEIERIREKERNRILELLVSNEYLEKVLDKVVQLLENEVGGSYCLILLRKSDGWHLGTTPGSAAAAGFPRDWRAALASPHSVPFEVWKQPCEFLAPELDPAWGIFTNCLTVCPPAAIRTHPIGSPDLPLGAILLFDKPPTPTPRTHWRSADASGPGKAGPDKTSGDIAGILESAARLARVAIEHSHFYDDLQFQAHHDALTGLANRALFEDRLTAALSEARELSQTLALLFVDLDRFKQINDTISHRAGDIFLTEIAGRLRRAVRPGDTVARIGGDEFNILITNIGSQSDAEEIAGRVLDAMGQPMIVDGHSVAGSASIGVAMFPEDGIEAEDLRREADAAMYCAKGLGGNRVQSFGARNQTLDRVRMDRELRVALSDRTFAVHYQPKVAADGHFGGLEALLRLDHPQYGPIGPAQFIPVAEESGLIVPLGAWILDEVCRQMADWRACGMGQISVAVNVSSVQICRPDFARIVQDCLVRHGISPWSIELELTESLLISGAEEPQRQMRQLRALGIRFSIDDFGTGYSSLSYLHRLQVDAIKLDRSFVQSIDTDPAARRLVQAMIGVAESLGLNVIAEGVETEAQRAALIAAGCPMMQGFLFSRPRPAAELEDYLRGSTSNPDDLLRIGSRAANGVTSAAMPFTV
jgi:diguanylate cyclase (GGDEF)-like protein